MSVWDDVIGQPHAVATLQRAVAASRGGSDDAQGFTNSWLITGPPGSGRSVLAMAFATALLCPNGGCGKCASCTQAAAGTNPDLTSVITETVQLDIGTARELVERASMSPMSGPLRVLVVEDADRMAARTSNTLLKAIEEPPASTVWVLCAPSEADLLPTIRSRVRTVPLGTPSAEAVAELLQRRHGVAADLALRAAREAQSHVGMAARLVTSPEAWQRRERALGGLATLQGTGNAVRKAAEWVAIAEEDGKAAAADRDERERAELFRSLGVPEGQAVPRQLRSMVRDLEEHQKKRARRATLDGVDRILTDAQSLWRDVLMTALEIPVTLVNEALRDDVQAAAARLGPERALANMAAIDTAREQIAANVPPALALEALLIRSSTRTP